MLAQILPGIREVRGPLVCGFLWMLLGWLALHDGVSRADGMLGELVDLGAHLTPAILVAAASFGAYLVGSLSDDVFGRAINEFMRFLADVRLGTPDNSPDETNEALRDREIARLENLGDRLRAESDLRIAILPPLVALAIYLGVEDNARWLLGLLLGPAFLAQAWIRTREMITVDRARYRLRLAAGLPPASSSEAKARDS